MKVTIFGAGYVGLVSAACFAELGHEVICLDVDQEKIAKLQAGESPIYEPGLTEMLQRQLQNKRLNFTTDVATAVEHGLFQFIAVGTPSDQDGSADLRYVLAVAKNIGQHLQKYAIIVNKSTVPVGTAQQVKDIIATTLADRHLVIEFDVASNPEFLKEGHAIEDFMKPDRIIVGAEHQRVFDKLKQLYGHLSKQEGRFICMSIPSAELAKYAANAFLATKISFMNAMSQLAEAVGADVEDIRVGIGTDGRISPRFLYAGCGYGGSCFPKDVRALQKLTEQRGLTNEILAAVETINERQKQVLIKKITQYFGEDLNQKVIALWGLSFKPNTNDMREASSRVLMEALWQKGAIVQAYDPVANDETQKIYGERPNLRFCASAHQALEGADALAIVTEWQEFRYPDFEFIKQKLSHPVIFDGRNLYDPALVAASGLDYYAIGRAARVDHES